MEGDKKQRQAGRRNELEEIVCTFLCCLLCFVFFLNIPMLLFETTALNETKGKKKTERGKKRTVWASLERRMNRWKRREEEEEGAHDLVWMHACILVCVCAHLWANIMRGCVVFVHTRVYVRILMYVCSFFSSPLASLHLHLWHVNVCLLTGEEPLTV